MKRYILLYFLLLSLASATAQTPEKHLSFMGMQMVGTSDVFASRLKKKGFTQKKKIESITYFYGKFANEFVELELIASPITNTVCKIVVYFPFKKTWKSLKEDYLNKRKLYSLKYFRTDDFSFFSSPYDEGDGYELRAVQEGKCDYASFYEEEGGHLSLEISPKQKVKVSYEDDINMLIAKKELERKAYNDI